MYAAIDQKAAAEPYVIDQRKRRSSEKRPAFTEKSRVTLDENGLDRRASAFRDKGKATFKFADRVTRGAGPFWENQDVPAGSQLLLSANGQQMVFEIDKAGCLDGGGVYGKFCKS